MKTLATVWIMSVAIILTILGIWIIVQAGNIVAVLMFANAISCFYLAIMMIRKEQRIDPNVLEGLDNRLLGPNFPSINDKK